ncbi:MAG: hypothetical protein D6706_08290 [Chloroflexi bacterium]|nr:MAG: hypothetical protein D6706_08290 [Chloroflexota bacterium]
MFAYLFLALTVALAIPLAIFYLILRFLSVTVQLMAEAAGIFVLTVLSMGGTVCPDEYILGILKQGFLSILDLYVEDIQEPEPRPRQQRQRQQQPQRQRRQQRQQPQQLAITPLEAQLETIQRKEFIAYAPKITGAQAMKMMENSKLPSRTVNKSDVASGKYWQYDRETDGVVLKPKDGLKKGVGFLASIDGIIHFCRWN